MWPRKRKIIKNYDELTVRTYFQKIKVLVQFIILFHSIYLSFLFFYKLLHNIKYRKNKNKKHKVNETNYISDLTIFIYLKKFKY